MKVNIMTRIMYYHLQVLPEVLVNCVAVLECIQIRLWRDQVTFQLQNIKSLLFQSVTLYNHLFNLDLTRQVSHFQ